MLKKKKQFLQGGLRVRSFGFIHSLTHSLTHSLARSFTHPPIQVSNTLKKNIGSELLACTSCYRVQRLVSSPRNGYNALKTASLVRVWALVNLLLVPTCSSSSFNLVVSTERFHVIASILVLLNGGHVGAPNETCGSYNYTLFFCLNAFLLFQHICMGALTSWVKTPYCSATIPSGEDAESSSFWMQLRGSFHTADHQCLFDQQRSDYPGLRGFSWFSTLRGSLAALSFGEKSRKTSGTRVVVKLWLAKKDRSILQRTKLIF